MLNVFGIWAVVCDQDVLDMSDALGHPYAFEEFLRMRLSLTGGERVLAIHTHRRINAWEDPAPFEAQLDELRTRLQRNIAKGLAQVQALLGSGCNCLAPTSDYHSIARAGAALLVEVEARLAAGGPDADRLASDGFRRTMAELSLTLSKNLNRRSVFADATLPVPSAQLPDRTTMDMAGERRHFLVPVSFQALL